MSNHNPIIKDTGSHYIKDGVWYEKVFGPSPDIALRNFGPGPNPRPPNHYYPLPKKVEKINLTQKK